MKLIGALLLLAVLIFGCGATVELTGNATVTVVPDLTVLQKYFTDYCARTVPAYRTADCAQIMMDNFLAELQGANAVMVKQ